MQIKKQISNLDKNILLKFMSEEEFKKLDDVLNNKIDFTKYRRCYKCGIIKPLSDFHKNDNVKYGGTCKQCINEVNKLYRTNRNNKN